MTLLEERQGKTYVVLTLARPPANAFSTEMYGELAARLLRAHTDPAIRTVILASSVPRIYSGGVDTKEFRDAAGDTARQRDQRTILGYEVWRQLRTSPLVTIAAIEGAAVGAGFLTALSCDLRIASDQARFCLPELSVGGMGGGAFLRRAGVSEGDVRTILLSGEFIDAQEAHRCHIVNRLVRPGQAVDAAIAFADRLGSYDPDVLKAANRALKVGEGSLHEASIYAELAIIEEQRRANRPNVSS